MNTKEIIQELTLQFLKGQLNEFELVNRLITSTEKNGAGLSQEQAQKIFDKLLGYKNKLEHHGKTVDQVISSKNIAEDKTDTSVPSKILKENEEVIDVKSEEEIKTPPSRPPQAPATTVVRSKPIMLEDLQIDSHKEESVGYHDNHVPLSSREKSIQELLINPGHDINMPLGEHIKFHFDQIKAEPELPAAPKQLEVTTPAPLKNIPVKTSPDKIMPPAPAPLPSRVTVKPLESKTTDDMISVDKKPVLEAPTSGDILPQRVMPDQLKKLVDQDMAPQGGDVIMEAIAKGRKKPGFFSRVFSRNKSVAEVPSTKVSPLMPRETINAIPMNQGRPQMTDVTFTPKLVTPVDELQSLTLQDFRRLSKDPSVAIKKISDKLELLAQESLRKKSQGIEALKKSALYSNYSAIMSESVMKGISYNQVILDKKTLTEGEYQALMQLNKLLRS